MSWQLDRRSLPIRSDDPSGRTAALEFPLPRALRPAASAMLLVRQRRSGMLATQEKPEMRLTDFKVLTFDCYGTLIDWESGMVEALKPLTSTINRPSHAERNSGSACAP